ncbi:ABC transporter ATP-binding protein, partial [Anaerosporobacter sp.]
MKLQAKKVSKTFIRKGNGEKIALNEISFTLKEGSFCCITGESGRGKSTLLNILTGLLKPSSGKVFIDGKELYGDYTEKQRTELRNQKIGYMMQGAALLENLTVYQNIVCPREIKGQIVPRETVDVILEKLNISSIQNSYPSEISGGEYRRVSLART